MDNSELTILVEAFKEYRDLLHPIQASMASFAATYNSMRENVQKLSLAFDSNAKEGLDTINKTLAEQANKATDLSTRIDSFLRLTSKIDQMLNSFSRLEDRIKSVNEIEKKAEQQLEKLDTLLTEKAKNYDLRELNKTLQDYNSNVIRISEFINKDVAETLFSGKSKLEEMQGGLEGIVNRQRTEGESLENLLQTYNQSLALLKRIAEGGDVNQIYIYDILDRWAEDRKLKIKK